MNRALEEKTAFFDLVEASFADDEFDEAECEQRARQGRFVDPKTRPAPVVHAANGAKHTQDAERQRPKTSALVTKGTPTTALEPKRRLDALLNSEEDDVNANVKVKVNVNVGAVGETPVADSAQPKSPPSLSRIFTQSIMENRTSPSLAAKKRKRDAPIRPRPENEQVLRELSFFYIPDNDVAPGRRMRIRRAREYGATWTRLPSSATHIVVEKHLHYDDVKGVLALANRPEPPKIVNEDYPLDCIQFKTVLNHNQNKYHLPGQTAMKPRPVVSDSDKVATPQTDAALGNIPLNKAPNPEKYTGTTNQRSTGQQHHQRSLNRHERPQPDVNDGRDELSEYINMMQEFKDLPIEMEAEDDAMAAMDLTETQTDSDEAADLEGERKRPRKSLKKRPSGTSKGLAFEDRFACNQAGPQNVGAGNPNARTIEVLQKMATYYDRINDHWRTRAYRKAMTVLKRQDTKISTEKEALRLPNIGQGLAQKIEEIVTTDGLKRLEYAQGEPMDESLQLFLGIYGVGNAQAQQWVSQGFRTLEDLKEKAKLTQNQLVGVEHYDDLNTRIPRREVGALGRVVSKAAAQIDQEMQLIIGGSYRRGAGSSGDIDLIITKPKTEASSEMRPFLDALVHKLETDGFLVARLASSRSANDGSKWHGCCALPKIKGFNDDDDYRPVWRRIDFLLVPETELGAAMLYFTGNDLFNRSMRLLASTKGMRLNQRGLYKDVMRGPQRVKVTEGELVEGRDERRIFEILGVKWREPHERWC